MATNILIYNGAFCGFVQGASSAWLKSSVEADYANLNAAADAFATQVDSKIPESEGFGAADSMLMQSICAGVMAQRYNTSAAAQVASFWDAIASSIAATFNATSGSILS